jgi:RNA recognition motif-containing protein
VGNIVVRNLPKNINQKDLYDIFSAFGNVVSCKLVQDKYGVSKQFGYVQFETEGAAKEAIEVMDGITLGDSLIAVSRFMKHQDARVPKRPAHDEINPLLRFKMPDRTLYVNDINPSTTDEQFKEAFSTYGQITSAGFIEMRINHRRHPKHFGFVRFAYIESAIQAMDDMRYNLSAEAMHEKRWTVAYHPLIERAKNSYAHSYMDDLDPSKKAARDGLYPLIEDIQPILFGDITFMLVMAFKLEELIEMLESPEVLAKEVEEARIVLCSEERNPCTMSAGCFV